MWVDLKIKPHKVSTSNVYSVSLVTSAKAVTFCRLKACTDFDLCCNDFRGPKNASFRE